MSEFHAADAEDAFVVINVTPDFCEVDNKVVAYDPFQFLVPDLKNYSAKTFGRGVRILTRGSIVRGVLCNAGKGIKSGVSLANGHNLVLGNASGVLVEGRILARHKDIALMNSAV